MAAVPHSTLTNSWIMSNLLVRCSGNFDLGKNSGAVRDYFQDSSRSGGGRLLGEGIKEINSTEFIISFVDNERESFFLTSISSTHHIKLYFVC